MQKQLIIFFILFTIIKTQENFSVIYQWKVMDFIWPSQSARNQALINGDYIPENNAISGIKIWKDQIYLTIPRWKNGVPVTLGVISIKSQEINPNLQPYPNWNMQKIGNCEAFQFIQSMEIDPMGRMWIIDTGRTETMTSNPISQCPPKIIILDLENGGIILKNYIIPSTISHHDSVILDDLVLDYEDGGFAYITDTSLIDPGIIVYSLKNNISWKIHHRSMWAENEEAMHIIVNKTHVRRPTNVDGIALSSVNSKNRMIYYTPLAAFNLYALPTWILKNEKQATNDINKFVQIVGKRKTQTDGMMISSDDILYFGLFGENAIAFWNITQNIDENYNNSSYTVNQKILVKDNNNIQWPDAFEIDKNGFLWCVPNSLQNFLTNNVNINIVNYRIIKINIGSKSYQFFKNGSAPVWPNI